MAQLLWNSETHNWADNTFGTFFSEVKTFLDSLYPVIIQKIVWYLLKSTFIETQERNRGNKITLTNKKLVSFFPKNMECQFVVTKKLSVP